MDEQEFRRMLDLFPVVRSRDYCKPESESSSKGTTQQARSLIEGPKKEPSAAEDLFLRKLKLAAEKKVGATKAELFCKTFEEAHEKLVYKELNLDAAQRFLDAYKS
ncbi:uncharacterized protein LOC100843634 isoform X2 [Brachypodium distachyon]|uniref:Uncharacterized protein n=1 Tax=Brachypodium distachyon TaxID=15368 RepID=A0A0Q3KUW0_BRADI|nr:uncharacterized protein LOC100843634 isoform X2 [Brachypodium distachyon]KQK14969.1 hypothetical protein BRADI_1g19850v3 [Brachypodium distachyon]|eukprot:XP_010234844.1 uncharacterized protein LOC100843634 isoform X2 [Brachypodium distachyon]